MKNIIHSLFWLAVTVLPFSCADDSLDPLQFKAVKKGTILALRGTALQNIYVKGVPAAEVFPKIANGTESFNFEAEFLSEDPNALESIDIFVVKREGGGRTRVAIKNVPFSAFKNDGKYVRPWVSLTLSFKDEILPKLGLSNTFPLQEAVIEKLLTTYASGVNIEIDLNLIDGTKVLASDLVAAGLYQSNQFYPAQKLTWAMTDYCSYDPNSWAGSYKATENRSTVYGPYAVTLTKDPAVANKFWLTNFWDCQDNGYYLVFDVSSNPSTQVVSFPEQTTSTGKVSGSGTYNQCLGTLSINVKYDHTAASCAGAAGNDTFRYDFEPGN
jgi:hypothetical protein